MELDQQACTPSPMHLGQLSPSPKQAEMQLARRAGLSDFRSEKTEEVGVDMVLSILQMRIPGLGEVGWFVRGHPDRM